MARYETYKKEKALKVIFLVNDGVREALNSCTYRLTYTSDWYDHPVAQNFMQWAKRLQVPMKTRISNPSNLVHHRFPIIFQIGK